MSKKTLELIELINDGKTCNEICTELSISNKQLFHYLTILKNKGIQYSQKYYDNGDIIYKLSKSLAPLNINSNQIIIPNNNYLKCLLISDLHFGNNLERLDLVNQAFDYCTKNDIHTILCLGDMIDGTYSKYEQNISDTYKQIEYFIKKYPFDKNILTFGVFGDHDSSALYKNSQSIAQALKNYRHDIIVNNNPTLTINVKNDTIFLCHDMKNRLTSISSPIRLYGHSHKYMVRHIKNEIMDILVPSLSNINISLPTALELTIYFDKNNIYVAKLKQIYFDNKPIILNECSYSLSKEKNNSDNNEKILQKQL